MTHASPLATQGKTHASPLATQGKTQASPSASGYAFQLRLDKTPGKTQAQP